MARCVLQAALVFGLLYGLVWVLARWAGVVW
jgi:hypothetical protein